MVRSSFDTVSELEKLLREGEALPEELFDRMSQSELLCRAMLERDSVLPCRSHRAQKLEALTLLAGGIADELDALIVNVLQQSDKALRSMSKDDAARDPIASIVTTVRRSAELCQQLRAYSGRETLSRVPLDLRELVEEMAHLLHVSVSPVATIQFNFDEALPAIEADATQLRQVILNLIVNASESLGESDAVISLSIGCAEVEAGTFSESCLHGDITAGAYVFFRIADKGSGLSEDDKANLFDPFYKGKYLGSGLALSSVLGIVREHGGAISVEGKIGKGATVTAYFPVSDGPASMVVEPPATAPPWRGDGTVLIVDDEPNARKIAQLFLEEVGFEVLLAEDGRRGVELFGEHANEVVAVVLDLTMPHMSGAETFHELRKIRRDIPVLLSSGYSEQDVTDRFSGQPWAGFIQKPYRFAALVFKLKEILALGV